MFTKFLLALFAMLCMFSCTLAAPASLMGRTYHSNRADAGFPVFDVLPVNAERMDNDFAVKAGPVTYIPAHLVRNGVGETQTTRASRFSARVDRKNRMVAELD